MRRLRSVFAVSRIVAILAMAGWGVSDVRAAAVVTDLGGGQYRVEFRFNASSEVKTVHLAGTFNGWDPHAHAMVGPDNEHAFHTTPILPKGRHEYKFVTDGQTWHTDPDNPHKTQGYQNAVLFLGVEPPEERTVPPPGPVEMAGEVEYPQVIKDLIAALKQPDSVAWLGQIKRFADEKRMPLFADKSVTFVYVHHEASEVAVETSSCGARCGYAMQCLVDGRPVFAVSLDRAKLPERMTYAFRVFDRNGQEDLVLDPLAWSVTSRGGRPAALAVEASDKRGRIEVICDVRPTVGGLRSRDVYVYLPPGYDRDKERRYPVLYMHDGQNCWDDPVEPFGHGGWCVNLTADRLINDGKVRPFIAVGVANTPDRMREYGLGENSSDPAVHSYIEFLRRDVKPRIDRTYRTQADAAHTGLMGSSMGGVVSMQAALLHPDTFGMAACLSPAFGYEGNTERQYAALVRSIGRVPVRLYIDSGTAGRGQDGAPATRRMVTLLRETGWKNEADLLHFEDTGAEHNERAWRARLEKPLAFLFGPQREGPAKRRPS